jgi:hypothetical protein
VLKPGDQWLCITFRQPHFMNPLLAREDLWTLSVEKLGDGAGVFDYFGFIMKRHQGPDFGHQASVIESKQTLLGGEPGPNGLHETQL